jgi:hypothetical protein
LQSAVGQVLAPLALAHHLANHEGVEGEVLLGLPAFEMVAAQGHGHGRRGADLVGAPHALGDDGKDLHQETDLVSEALA